MKTHCFLIALAALTGLALTPVVAIGQPDGISQASRDPDEARSDGSTGRCETDRPFSVRRAGRAAWLVRPRGERFFSLGVCCVDQGTTRDQYLEERPGYAAWRYYPSGEAWSRATLGRLQSWGFTTAGGWSDFTTLRSSPDADLVFAPVLHVGSTAGAPWWDMWDPRIMDRMERVAEDGIRAIRDDPRVMGYYSDNEMGWWNAALFRLTLEQVATSEQRRRLVALLRRTYHDRWDRLLRDFDPEGLDSFADLERGGGKLYLRGGGSGMRVLREFLSLAAERYYSLVREIIKRKDARALFLGDRYQSFYYPEVARAAGRHADVVSCNLNAGWNDGSFPRFQLDTLHALTGRPILVSEFYLVARENRSGNENPPGFPVVDTQRERAAGFRRTVETLLRIPYVVGADWFQYYDEPTFGRADGENYSFGLVDIRDRPYDELAQTSTGLDLEGIKVRGGRRRPDASQGVPLAPPEPFSRFEPHQALGSWDRDRGFVRPASTHPLADLYVCWSPEALYLGVYAQDVVEVECYRDRRVPDADRAEWVVAAGQPRRIWRARVGAGGAVVTGGGGVRVAHLSGVELKTRCLAAMELPAALFGRDRLRPGDRLDFASTFHTHCRVYRTDWRGSFRLGMTGIRPPPIRRDETSRAEAGGRTASENP